MSTSLLKRGWLCMVIPALCQAGLFSAEFYLNLESERISFIENNELEANATVLNLMAHSDHGWGIIFDESMIGKPVRRAEFAANQKMLKELLVDLKSLPMQNDLTKEIYAYTNKLVDVLAASEMSIGDHADEAGDIPHLLGRLAKVRRTAADYIANFQRLLDDLNEQRAEIHSLRLQKEKQQRLVQQFLIASLVFDAVVAFTLPVIFLNDITNRLKLLLDNAKRLPTNESLSKDIGGQDEITFLNSALYDVSERLSEAEQSKQLLMDMLAHDIRSPLTSAEILIHSVAEQNSQYSENTQTKISRLQNIFKQIKRLVEDLLSIEKLESGDFELKIDFFDMVELTKASLDTVEPQARAKDLVIENKASAPVIEVAADRERILQVLDNLLSNAVKHSPPKGTLRIILSESSDEIIVSIADQGPGVPKNKEHQVFERQFQTAEGRSQGGFGLGLSIAKQIVTRHGGKIDLQNVRPHGCLVTFSLPKDSDV